MSENTELDKRDTQPLKQLVQPAERKISLVDIPETGEYEIQRRPDESACFISSGGEVAELPAEQTIRFPKEYKDRLQMQPDDFQNAQNAIEEYSREKRTVEVYADSIESSIGYDSLLKVMSKFFSSRVAYYRSESGGSLSLEEARKEVYRRNITNEEAGQLLDKIISMPTEHIGFDHLLELNGNSPATAQNMWEMIKREAQNEFESGHLAAEAFEPADYMTDAWNRASYLGLRESLCEEWQPKGGIELSMIDAIAQSWLQLQFWTKESVRRAGTNPRQEDHQFHEWKKWKKEANPKQWENGYWDIPLVSEQTAIEHAAQMADRWQRMYFRAIKSLRDWRRYTPQQLTINNPNQVNIASDGGQQVNVSK